MSPSLARLMNNLTSSFLCRRSHKVGRQLLSCDESMIRSHARVVESHRGCITVVLSQRGQRGRFDHPLSLSDTIIPILAFATMLRLLVMRGCLLPALSYILFCSAALAAGTALFERFDWPQDVEGLLHSRHLRTAPSHYTEQQADEFLANALVYLKARSTGTGTYFITSGHMPRHRFWTEGIDRDAARRSTSTWFSAPLLTGAAHDAGRFEYLQVPLADGSTTRSLDVIRFDRFSPRPYTGFWVPTAIVRPELEKVPRTRLIFRTLYQYPTSPVLLRDAVRADPQQAWANLERVLAQKKDVWTAKLQTYDRVAIKEMLGRVPKSPLLSSSAFFERDTVRSLGQARRQRMMRAERGGQVPAESLSLEDELSDHSSSDEEDPRTVLESSEASVQRGQQDHGGASTGAASNVLEGRPVVAHDFLGGRGEGSSNQPIRPQALYPPQSGMWRTWQQIDHPDHTLPGDRNSDVNLDLTLAPPRSAQRRDRK